MISASTISLPVLHDCQSLVFIYSPAVHCAHVAYVYSSIHIVVSVGESGLERGETEFVRAPLILPDSIPGAALLLILAAALFRVCKLRRAQYFVASYVLRSFL